MIQATDIDSLLLLGVDALCSVAVQCLDSLQAHLFSFFNSTSRFYTSGFFLAWLCLVMQRMCSYRMYSK